MEILATDLDEVLVLAPRVFGDARGYFLETWQQARYAEHGVGPAFVQDNVSYSQHGVLRGLHLQYPQPQGKLVQVLAGEVFDVAVDVRRGSPRFGRWTGVRLSAENKHQLWIPPGFAHGFLVTGREALFAYKCTDYYRPETELTVRFDDPRIGIDWPLAETPSVSDKDRDGRRLEDIPEAELPPYPG